MKLILLITAQNHLGLDVAQAWQAAGAPGVTVIPSHGLVSLQKQFQHGDYELPMTTFSLGAAMANMLNHAQNEVTIFMSIVEDEQVAALIAEANRVLGDLSEAGNGILITLAVDTAIGVRRYGA